MCITKRTGDAFTSKKTKEKIKDRKRADGKGKKL